MILYTNRINPVTLSQERYNLFGDKTGLTSASAFDESMLEDCSSL